MPDAVRHYPAPSQAGGAGQPLRRIQMIGVEAPSMGISAPVT